MTPGRVRVQPNRYAFDPRPRMERFVVIVAGSETDGAEGHNPRRAGDGTEGVQNPIHRAVAPRRYDQLFPALQKAADLSGQGGRGRNFGYGMIPVTVLHFKGDSGPLFQAASAVA